MSLATEIAGKLNYLNTQDNVTANATLPYSGYTQVSKKLDNFVFQTSSSFLNKVADKNRYVKFGEKVVDTYGPELITNGDFSNGTTGWVKAGSGNSYVNTNGKLFSVNEEVYQDINTSVGKTYIISVGYYRSLSTYNGNLRVRNSSLATIYDTGATLNYDGIKYFTFIATTPTSRISLLNYANANTEVYDNISAREIQTAQFTVPNVTEIITNGSNTTSVAVSAGDYVVVDRKELVTNGTFDSDISGWNNTDTSRGTISYSSGKIRVTNDGTNNYPNASQQLTNLIPGNRYIVEADIDIGTSTRARLYSYLLGSTDATSSGKYNLVFTATSSSHNVVLYNYETGNTGSYVEFDNISVKQVDETYRAKIDAPIGTALTNTTYFEDRTQIGVTNQQLAYHAYNVLTNSYEGIKTEVLFSDVSKEDLLNNSVWMVRNGFSKVSEFLYSKGSYLVVPVGIWQSLNNGAYHPVFNGFGTRGTNDTVIDGTWYNVNQSIITSVAKTFTNTSINASYGTGHIDTYSPMRGNLIWNGTTNVGCRPDSKFYDIVYQDQFIDVREYAKVLNPYEVDLIRADKEENGVEEIVAFYSGNNLATSTGASSLYVTSSSFPAYAELKRGDKVYHNGQIRTINYIGGTLPNVDIYLTETINRVANEIIILYKTEPVLSSNTKLSTDLIGNPTNYPQIMKDRLASGVGIVGVNPLLIEN